ncbi:X-ray repair cross-complementing protein 5 [Megalopta genalis]|uniref:X-ray repair cross-complementing protein 5 n=1 Tax=Megalopta genalis TaxID=115081 RepID=UPI003FCF011D
MLDQLRRTREKINKLQGHGNNAGLWNIFLIKYLLQLNFCKMPPSKDALVLLINIGVTCPGKETNPAVLEKFKHIAKRIIDKKIFLRPKDEIAVILMGSSITKNSIDTEYVQEYIDFEVPNWELIEKIMHLHATKHCSNWIEAVIATVKYIEDNAIDNDKSVIFLMSDFNEGVDIISQFQVDKIAEDLNTHEIQLLTIGEELLENKPKGSLNVSEKFLKNLHEKINGQHLTFDNVISELKFYGDVLTKSMPWYANLKLADIEIPIVSYTKISEDNELSPWEIASEDKEVKSEVQYFNRERSSYNKDDAVAGYKYGGEFIPVGKDLEESLSYKGGPRCYMVHSFVCKDSIDLAWWYDDTSTIVLPSSRDENSVKPFYSFVQAMHTDKLVAIVRKVYSNNLTPKMVVLFPCIDDPDEPWCLVEISLPFAGEVRIVCPRSFKSVTKQLTNEQNEAVDNLLDSLMLPDTEDDGNIDRSQCFLPGCVPDPGLQHKWHALSHRALHPNEPLPPIEEYLKNILEVPLVKQNSKCHLQKIVELFQLESIEPTKKEKYDFKNTVDMQSNKKNDVEESIHATVKDDEGEDDEIKDDESEDAMDVDLDDLVDRL